MIMENRMKKLHKLMSLMLVVSALLWGVLNAILSYGIISWMSLLMLLLIAVILISGRKRAPDERELQISFTATYGAFTVTICFIFVAQIVQFIMSGSVSPIYGYILGVLLISEWLFNMVLRK